MNGIVVEHQSLHPKAAWFRLLQMAIPFSAMSGIDHRGRLSYLSVFCHVLHLTSICKLTWTMRLTTAPADFCRDLGGNWSEFGHVREGFSSSAEGMRMQVP